MCTFDNCNDCFAGKSARNFIVPSPQPVLQYGGRTSVSVMKFIGLLCTITFVHDCFYLSLEVFCLERRLVFSTRQIPSPEGDNPESIYFDTNCPCNRHLEPIFIKVSLQDCIETTVEIANTYVETSFGAHTRKLVPRLVPRAGTSPMV